MFVEATKMSTKGIALAVSAIAFLGVMAIAGAQNAAQGETQEQLLACDRISNVEDRLACFNSVVGGLKQSARTPVDEASPAIIETPDEPPAPPPPVEMAPAAPAAVVNEVAELPPAASVPAKEEVVDEPPMAPAAPASDFGLADQKAKAAREAARENRNEEQSEVVNSTIVEVSRVTGGRFEARLENGQVWRETEATRTARRPKVGDSVRITPGRLGSYRMKFNNDNRLAAVRRTQ